MPWSNAIHNDDSPALVLFPTLLVTAPREIPRRRLGEFPRVTLPTWRKASSSNWERWLPPICALLAKAQPAEFCEPSCRTCLGFRLMILRTSLHTRLPQYGIDYQPRLWTVPVLNISRLSWIKWLIHLSDFFFFFFLRCLLGWTSKSLRHLSHCNSL